MLKILIEMINMEINELTIGTNDVNIEGNITEVGETRNVNTRFGTKKVCSVTIEDDSGKINFSLWDEDINKIRLNDRVSINGAYVTDWRDQLQLNIPKKGSFEIKK